MRLTSLALCAFASLWATEAQAKAVADFYKLEVRVSFKNVGKSVSIHQLLATPETVSTVSESEVFTDLIAPSKQRTYSLWVSGSCWYSLTYYFSNGRIWTDPRQWNVCQNPNIYVTPLEP